MNHVSISHDGKRAWWLAGDGIAEACAFATLHEALAAGRELTHAAETMVELRVDGFYACVHQEAG